MQRAERKVNDFERAVGALKNVARVDVGVADPDIVQGEQHLEDFGSE